MSRLKADIGPKMPEAFDPSPLRFPPLTPQSSWTRKAVNDINHMQRILFLGFTDFKITSRKPKGQAELLRMLFHFGNIPYEDEILSEVDWKSLMCKMPYGNLPVLWMGHNVYGEMNVIVRHIAHHMALLGKNEREELLALSVLQQVQELRESDVLQEAFNEITRGLQDDNYEEAFEVMLPNLFAEWESYILASHSDFVLPSGISVADMAIFDFISQYRLYLPLDHLMENFPNLREHLSDVFRHPSLQTYFHKDSATLYSDPSSSTSTTKAAH